MTPQRMQRKRTRGYNMQAESLALNGLPAVYVGRPTKWGNPFHVSDGDCDHPDCGPRSHPVTKEMAVKSHSDWVIGMLRVEPTFLNPLRDKNLACYCPLIDEDGNAVLCHADVLLELANLEALEL
ncbi:MAG: DUF4326 domain-containing protein [Candidatus Brocadiales bacterium]|nr:DUF4326 domain-containing protein [Candidatus Bathyanammoxibius sp.]